MPGPLPFPGFAEAGVSTPRRARGQALLLSLPFSRPGPWSRPHPAQAVGASVGSELPGPRPSHTPDGELFVPTPSPVAGPTAGAQQGQWAEQGVRVQCEDAPDPCSEAFGRPADVCKGCGGSTLSTSCGFKSQSGLLARSQLWVAARTALGEALVFTLVPTVWRAGPASPTRRAPSPGSAWSWLWTCRACPAPGSAPHPSGSDSVSGRREAV